MDAAICYHNIVFDMIHSHLNSQIHKELWIWIIDTEGSAMWRFRFINWSWRLNILFLRLNLELESTTPITKHEIQIRLLEYYNSQWICIAHFLSDLTCV